jgi:hypothetical protein
MRLLEEGGIFAVGLTAASLAAVVAAGERIDWREAARCAGRVCTVTGTVTAQEEEDGVTRLYFDAVRRDVSVLLVRSLFVGWPDYTGRTIAATGLVRPFRDQIEVVVSRPRDLETGPEATPAEPRAPTPEPVTRPAAPARAATATEEGAATPARPIEAEPWRPAESRTPEAAEIERLRRRVEELEQRVRELEAEPAP